MKIKQFVLMTLLMLVCVSCHSQKNASRKMVNAIHETYFQHWVAGVRGGGSGTNFYIKFKDAVPKGIILKQLYFRGKKASINKDSETQYSAMFSSKTNTERGSELDGQPKTDDKVTPPFPITEGEAILEYTYKGKKTFYKLHKIKEREMLAYPSARPRN